MNSQINLVRDHLQRGKTITPLEALREYGSLRLSAIIFNLKKEGMSGKYYWIQKSLIMMGLERLGGL